MKSEILQKYSLFPVNSLSAAKLFEIARLVWLDCMY